ncbi:MAG: TetR/AcrR family transcriptional regulator [Pseudomonadota bacterium]
MATDSIKAKALRERRSRIVDAALSCFLEFGYNQTGIRQIAKRAGISLGNLYNHFSSKEDVLAEIAVLEQKELLPYQQMLADHEHPMSTLMLFTSAYAAYAATPDYVLLSIEIEGEALRNPQIAELFMANRLILAQALGALLRKGVEDECFRDFEDADQTAELILDTIEGHAMRHHLVEAGKLSGIDDLKAFIRHATSR